MATLYSFLCQHGYHGTKASSTTSFFFWQWDLIEFFNSQTATAACFQSIPKDLYRRSNQIDMITVPFCLEILNLETVIASWPKNERVGQNSVYSILTQQRLFMSSNYWLHSFNDYEKWNRVQVILVMTIHLGYNHYSISPDLAPEAFGQEI